MDLHLFYIMLQRPVYLPLESEAMRDFLRYVSRYLAGTFFSFWFNGGRAMGGGQPMIQTLAVHHSLGRCCNQHPTHTFTDKLFRVEME